MKQKDVQDSAKRATLGKLSGLVGIVCNVWREVSWQSENLRVPCRLQQTA